MCYELSDSFQNRKSIKHLMIINGIKFDTLILYICVLVINIVYMCTVYLCVCNRGIYIYTSHTLDVNNIRFIVSSC